MREAGRSAPAPMKLIIAVKDKDVPAALRLLGRGVDPNCRGVRLFVLLSVVQGFVCTGACWV